MDILPQGKENHANTGILAYGNLLLSGNGRIGKQHLQAVLRQGRVLAVPGLLQTAQDISSRIWAASMASLFTTSLMSELRISRILFDEYHMPRYLISSASKKVKLQKHEIFR